MAIDERHAALVEAGQVFGVVVVDEEVRRVRRWRGVEHGVRQHGTGVDLDDQAGAQVGGELRRRQIDGRRRAVGGEVGLVVGAVDVVAADVWGAVAQLRLLPPVQAHPEVVGRVAVDDLVDPTRLGEDGRRAGNVTGDAADRLPAGFADLDRERVTADRPDPARAAGHRGLWVDPHEQRLLLLVAVVGDVAAQHVGELFGERARGCALAGERVDGALERGVVEPRGLGALQNQRQGGDVGGLDERRGVREAGAGVEPELAAGLRPVAFRVALQHDDVAPAAGRGVPQLRDGRRVGGRAAAQ